VLLVAWCLAQLANIFPQGGFQIKRGLVTVGSHQGGKFMDDRLPGCPLKQTQSRIRPSKSKSRYTLPGALIHCNYSKLPQSHHLDGLSRSCIGRIHRSASLASLGTADPLWTMLGGIVLVLSLNSTRNTALACMKMNPDSTITSY
jgi:hypothetical protein